MNLRNLRRARDAFANVEVVDMANYFTLYRDGKRLVPLAVGSADYARANGADDCKTAYCLAGTIQDVFATGHDRTMYASEFAERFLNRGCEVVRMAPLGVVGQTMADALFHDGLMYGYPNQHDIKKVTKGDVLGKLDELIAEIESEQ